jgi:hypothetical protein
MVADGEAVSTAVGAAVVVTTAVGTTVVEATVVEATVVETTVAGASEAVGAGVAVCALQAASNRRAVRRAGRTINLCLRGFMLSSPYKVVFHFTKWKTRNSLGRVGAGSSADCANQNSTIIPNISNGYCT